MTSSFSYIWKVKVKQVLRFLQFQQTIYSQLFVKYRNGEHADLKSIESTPSV